MVWPWSVIVIREAGVIQVPGGPWWLAPGFLPRVLGLAHVDRGVVDDERGLQFVVFAAGELQRDGLPGVGAQREARLGVSGVVVEVGVGVQRGQYCAGAIEDLNL